MANETILYVSNTTGAVKYKGERGEKNSVAKVLDYTPRPIDLDTGIIEDVINVNNDKVAREEIIAEGKDPKKYNR